ncbi:TPA: DNA-binding response regulator [Escherichia coli]|uniref:DNA-binding response regulator n=1 Tax=Salmonella enterica TaxID=28901 RepID=A0A721HS57_SALER|nr:DNA-binding response regulator [Salmonella enterica]HAD8324735.1 DNA-binding response regulator [Salmonella enterica]
MTKHDAIRISQLHQIFPEVQLTERQKDIAVMYVIGCTVEEIASEKGITTDGVMYHLNLVKRAVGSATLAGVRTTAFLRMMAILLTRES